MYFFTPTGRNVGGLIMVSAILRPPTTFLDAAIASAAAADDDAADDASVRRRIPDHAPASSLTAPRMACARSVRRRCWHAMEGRKAKRTK